jgi:hypothetical protein
LRADRHLFLSIHPGAASCPKSHRCTSHSYRPRAGHSWYRRLHARPSQRIRTSF